MIKNLPPWSVALMLCGGSLAGYGSGVLFWAEYAQAPVIGSAIGFFLMLLVAFDEDRKRGS